MKLWIGSLMMIWLNWLGRWRLTSRLKVKQSWIRRQARRAPREFRRHVRIDVDREIPFARQIQPWQHHDFQALDPAWLQLAAHAPSLPPSVSPSLGPQPKTRAWIERPRGHSKTSDVALQIAWILLHANKPLRGLAAAADRDQAALIADALERVARLNPLLCDGLVFQKNVIFNPANDARLDILSSDVQSSWGQLPDFIICDELCHWSQPDLWHSLLSSAAKRPHCLLLVLTNAGVGRDWHWTAREEARQSPRWHFSSLDGPHAPWITPDLLDEQRRLLPQPVFERLWLNRWQHSDGDFVTLAEADACIDATLAPQTHGQPGTRYFAAIDYAEKHDFTAAILLHEETDAARCSVPQPSTLNPKPTLIVDRLDVHVPTPDRPTPVAWVERWIREIAARFHHVTFILDEYQLVGTIQNLQHEFDIRRFPFRAGKGNHDLATHLRALILERRLRWHPGCGQLPDPASSPGDPLTRPFDPAFAPSLPPSVSPSLNPSIPNAGPRDDLATELAALVFKQSPSGLCRIDHKPGRHDDRAFALGAAALAALSEPRNDFFTITPPSRAGGFNL